MDDSLFAVIILVFALLIALVSLSMIVKVVIGIPPWAPPPFRTERNRTSVERGGGRRFAVRADRCVLHDTHNAYKAAW